MELGGKKIALFVADDYEDLEVWYPKLRLKEAGADVTVIGPDFGPDICTGKHGYKIELDRRAADVDSDSFDAAIVPGGWAPDKLRQCQNIVNIISKMVEYNKLIASICHGGWVLASADIVEGVEMTSTPAIKDDLEHAGAKWVNEEVVIDQKIVSSRAPGDLPAFCRTIIKKL